MIDEKNREILIGGNRFYLGKDNIMYVTQSGEIDDKMAIDAREALFKLLNGVEGKVRWLVDLNASGKQSPEARKLQKEITEHEKTGRCALFGVHPVARMIASFGIGLSRKKDMRFFKTKEEAIAWLKE